MTKLTLQIGDKTMSGELDYDDASINELFELFKGLLIGHTFYEAQFIDSCKEFGADEC